MLMLIQMVVNYSKRAFVSKTTTGCEKTTRKANSYKVKNGLLKMAFSDEPISNKIF